MILPLTKYVIISAKGCRSFPIKSFVSRYVIPKFRSYINFFKVVSLFPESFDKLVTITKEIIRTRKSEKVASGDFIDRLIEILDQIQEPLTPG